MAIAAILALRCYDSNLYHKHIYQPVLKFLIKNKTMISTKSIASQRRFSREFVLYKWAVASNRLPYIVKSVKNFFKKFNK